MPMAKGCGVPGLARSWSVGSRAQGRRLSSRRTRSIEEGVDGEKDEASSSLPPLALQEVMRPSFPLAAMVQPLQLCLWYVCTYARLSCTGYAQHPRPQGIGYNHSELHRAVKLQSL